MKKPVDAEKPKTQTHHKSDQRADKKYSKPKLTVQGKLEKLTAGSGDGVEF
jgi:hypothetical protein